MTPEQVEQIQLEAYYSPDLEGLMSLIDSNITLYDFKSDMTTMQGYAACREFYGALDKNSAKLHSIIVNRTVFGSWVIDHEKSKGRNRNKEVQQLAQIY